MINSRKISENKQQQFRDFKVPRNSSVRERATTSLSYWRNI